jgi:hypothetical protein
MIQVLIRLWNLANFQQETLPDVSLRWESLAMVATFGNQDELQIEEWPFFLGKVLEPRLDRIWEHWEDVTVDGEDVHVWVEGKESKLEMGWMRNLDEAHEETLEE